MARRIAPTKVIRLKQADKLERAHDHAIRLGFPLSHKFDINWGYTKFRDQPLKGLQVAIEATRKWLQRNGVACIAFIWVRERPDMHTCEGAHIALHVPAHLSKKLANAFYKWVGGFDPRAVKYDPFRREPKCNSRTWVLGYAIKGGTDAVRDRYPSARNRKWSHHQGEILGKRVGISMALTEKARRDHFAAAPVAVDGGLGEFRDQYARARGRVMGS
jgi:hypothetical protein